MKMKIAPLKDSVVAKEAWKGSEALSVFYSGNSRLSA